MATYRTRIDLLVFFEERGWMASAGPADGVEVDVCSDRHPALFSDDAPVEMVSHEAMIRATGYGELTESWRCRGFDEQQIRSVLYYLKGASCDGREATQTFDIAGVWG